MLTRIKRKLASIVEGFATRADLGDEWDRAELIEILRDHGKAVQDGTDELWGLPVVASMNIPPGVFGIVYQDPRGQQAFIIKDLG